MTVEHLSLSTARTVDRALVHRACLGEVFVTDSAPAGEETTRVRAQLPRAHSYFTDHLPRTGPFDPLLVLECARQAYTVVAHRELGVPPATSFMIRDWHTELVAGAWARDPAGVTEVDLDVTAVSLDRRRDRLRGAVLRADLAVGGVPAGTSTVSAVYLPNESYQGYRQLNRATPAPMSSDVPGRRHRPVEPAAVGRIDPGNVVVAEAESPGPGRVRALVDAPGAHPSLYDHPLDHVPAMVLMEAARQVSLLAAGGSPGDHYPARVDAVFREMAELDAPLWAEATAAEAGTVHVDLRQGERVVATVDLGLVPTPAEPATRPTDPADRQSPAGTARAAATPRPAP